MQLSDAAPCPSYVELAIANRTPTAAEWPIHVLLVEDNTDAAWSYIFTLTGDGGSQFHLEWTPNLYDAMTRLSQPGIEVVLLDLGLPEMTGYKSFLAVDAAGDRKIPVVVLTSDDSRDSRDLVLEHGASAYLIKDMVSPARLRGALLKAVRSGRRSV
jgi:two-component system catabolic regulation response regulator CreB